ncbi:hypothetical protein Salat_1485600 [Sesamum alatum]|uniref:Uncharacterized protein n=1 Tax=Sesamum alatum TaxID=300844 RepID=A0AAE1YBX6_9LAMI|nr:hypothetical protein Salat_1485600 [Sesamum alatum]
MELQDMSEGFGDDTENNSVCQPSSACDPTRKRKGKKRKSLDHNDPVVKLLDTFCTNTDKRLGDIAKRIGYEYDVSDARKEVYAEVGKIAGLTMQQKLAISKQIVKNTEYLDLFSVSLMKRSLSLFK